jgi:hypothetical protein
MTGDKNAETAQNVINAATAAASGVPKSVIDAGTTRPKPKPPTEDFPDPPPNEIAGGTVKISTP